MIELQGESYLDIPLESECAWCRSTGKQVKKGTFSYVGPRKCVVCNNEANVMYTPGSETPSPMTPVYCYEHRPSDPCDRCNGLGTVPTHAGKALLEFWNKYGGKL